MESVKESRPNVGLKSSDTERNPIRRRTQSDQMANAIQSDSGRNPIGQRTQMVTETTIWKQTNAHTNLANDAQQLNKSAAQASPLYSHAIRVPYGGQVRL